MRGDLATGYLTAQELTILRLIALGRHNRGMADLLGVGLSTIVKHRETLNRKLGARCPADLTRRAIELGVIVVAITPLKLAHVNRRERWLLP